MTKLLAALLLLAPVAASAAGFVLIVHPSNKAALISKADAQRIFLRARTSWGDGEACKPVDLPKASATRVAFSSDVLGKSMSAVDQFWTQAVFSGRAVPPPERKTDRDVVEYVRDNPGAIGYVAAGTALEGVKKLTLGD